MSQLCDDVAIVREFHEDTQRWEHKRDPVTGESVTKPCGSYAMTGFTKCVMHGRVDPEQRAQIAVKPQKRIGKLLTELDLPHMNPMDGLLEAVRYTAAMVRTLTVLVAELPEAPEIERGDYWENIPDRVKPGIWGLDRNGEQAPHVLMKLYDLWLDRYTRACKFAVDAGLDERMVRNAEATSGLMLTAFQKTLSQVALSQEQRDALAQGMAQNVRELIQANTKELAT